MKTDISAALISAVMAMFMWSCDGESTPNGEPITPEENIEPLTDEIRPILTNDKKWVIEMGLVGEDKTKFNCTLEDVISKGKPAKNVRMVDAVTGEDAELFKAIVREENGMVLLLTQMKGFDSEEYIEDDYEFRFALDIDSRQSETFDCSVGLPSVIISRGTIVLKGKTRRAIKVWCGFKQYYCDYPETDPYDYWVEGIGSLFGQVAVFYKIRPTTPAMYWKKRHRILECYDGDEMIYDYSEFSPALYNEEEVFTDADKQQQDNP